MRYLKTDHFRQLRLKTTKPTKWCTRARPKESGPSPFSNPRRLCCRLCEPKPPLLIRSTQPATNALLPALPHSLRNQRHECLESIRLELDRALLFGAHVSGHQQFCYFETI